MSSTKTYLVPLDFSKASEKALAHAVRLARENQAKLLLAHVVTDSASMVAFQFRDHYFEELHREAREHIRKLTRRHKLTAKNSRVLLLRGSNAAKMIADQAKKSRASMIILGSHARAGLSRLILGSVAEQILRYARCPVLIVKK